MSKQLREHIRTQLKAILESQGYYKDPKTGKIKQGDLAQAWKERMKSAIEDTDDQDDLSLKNVLKNLKDGSKSKEFKNVIKKKEDEIKEEDITEDDVTKAKKGALEAKIVADTLEREAKKKEGKLKEGEKDLSLKSVLKKVRKDTQGEDVIEEDITDDISKAEDDAAAARKSAAEAEVKVADAMKKKAEAEKAALEENLKKKNSKKKLKDYINEMIPSLLEADEEEESQEDDAFVPNHYKPEFIPREAEQALEKLGLTPIDRYVDFVNFMNSIPKSLKVVLTNGNSFLIYFDEDGLRLQIGANKIDISDDRNLPEAQDMINDLLMGPVDVPEEEEEEPAAEEEAPAEEEPAAEEEPEEEEEEV